MQSDVFSSNCPLPSPSSSPPLRLFVLDCVASGCMWVDMKARGVDIVITAPQKGWSGPACAGLVMCR